MLTVQDLQYCEEEGQADAAIEQSMLNARKSGPEASLQSCHNIGNIVEELFGYMQAMLCPKNGSVLLVGPKSTFHNIPIFPSCKFCS